MRRISVHQCFARRGMACPRICHFRATAEPRSISPSKRPKSFSPWRKWYGQIVVRVNRALRIDSTTRITRPLGASRRMARLGSNPRQRIVPVGVARQRRPRRDDRRGWPCCRAGTAGRLTIGSSRKSAMLHRYSPPVRVAAAWQWRMGALSSPETRERDSRRPLSEVICRIVFCGGVAGDPGRHRDPAKPSVLSATRRQR